jgi:hypothetical protein
LPKGQDLPNDQRLQPLKDLNGYFPFVAPDSNFDWAMRSNAVKTRLLVANGLWPEPEKTPLNPVVHGRIDQGEYTIDKVYFESVPGFYVTGNLYRPKNATGRRPAVLCPHGHWPNGRFHDAGEGKAKQQIDVGAETLANAGRSPLQARFVHLARMGYIVFHYDMIGYADNVQISFQLAHKFAKQRPEMNTNENWGFYSPQAESHLQSIMGLQTWGSIRAVDFMLTLPDVDPDRLAVTGASGGGTQTMFLAALDSRIAVSAPAVMVSTAMQGGCTCENCSLLRVGTGNVEFAALFAPKPQLVISADDWTKEMPSKGFPELQKLYAMQGNADSVAHNAHLQFKHNYNGVNRKRMYEWFNKHLEIEADTVERDFKRLGADELTVWNEDHPKPASGDAVERKLLREMHERWQTQLGEIMQKEPRRKSKKALLQHNRLIQDGIGTVIGAGVPDLDNVHFHRSAVSRPSETVEVVAGLLQNSELQSELPVVMIKPERWRETTTVWLDAAGKSALFDTDGTPIAPVQKLLANGVAVIGVDLLLYQGEFLKGGAAPTQTRKVANPREAASYTHAYNHALLAHRVHDVLTAIAWAQGDGARKVHLVGLKGAGHWAAAARAVAQHDVEKAAIDTDGFRFGRVPDIRHPDFLPGGAKYGDIPGMLWAAGPHHKLWLAGETEATAAAAISRYKAFGRYNLKLAEPADATSVAAVDWLLKK